ncbi:MAG: cupin domain-containing protein [Chloroflexi bacterium]|nr:cupin domain-containing protein [Chloroflexota bacterium]
MDHATWDELEEQQKGTRPGRTSVSAVMRGDAIEMSRVKYARNAGPPRHSHPHEQIISLTSGTLQVTVGKETWILKPGSVVCIPANAPHKVWVLEDSEFWSCKNLVEGKGSDGMETWLEARQ